MKEKKQNTYLLFFLCFNFWFCPEERKSTIFSDVFVLAGSNRLLEMTTERREGFDGFLTCSRTLHAPGKSIETDVVILYLWSELPEIDAEIHRWHQGTDNSYPAS